MAKKEKKEKNEEKEEDEELARREGEKNVREFIQFPCEVQKVSTLADGGITIKLLTPEMESEDMTRLFGLRNKTGWCNIKPTRLAEEEIANTPDDDVESFGKSKSERLRNTLLAYWIQKGRQGDFDTFYKRNMEALIERVKGKMDKTREYGK